MPFIKVPGLTGRVYVPEKTGPDKKKHNCPDCFSCQMCSQARCQVCRREKAGQSSGISIIDPAADDPTKKQGAAHVPPYRLARQ
ncbi:MAG: hypothetical protein ACLFPD_11035 [Desulfosudaceae bacterium]